MATAYRFSERRACSRGGESCKTYISVGAEVKIAIERRLHITCDLISILCRIELVTTKGANSAWTSGFASWQKPDDWSGILNIFSRQSWQQQLLSQWLDALQIESTLVSSSSSSPFFSTAAERKDKQSKLQRKQSKLQRKQSATKSCLVAYLWLRSFAWEELRGQH